MTLKTLLKEQNFTILANKIPARRKQKREGFTLPFVLHCQIGGTATLAQHFF